jgi:anti-sigma factor RsiW
MTCDDLDEYLDGSLAGSRLAAFLTHLDRCARCTLELAGQERLDRSLAAVSKALPPAPSCLVRRIECEIAAAEARRQSLLRWSVAAAVLVAGIGVGLGSLLHLDRVRDAETAPGDTGSSVPAVARVVPDPRPIASIVLGEGSHALAVPVAAKNVDATIVFVYPILGGGEAREDGE